MKIGGIYEIVNTANGRRYIGSAVSFGDRLARHKYELVRGKHANQKLQRAWNKYGEAAFDLRPIMVCFDSRELIPWEQRYMDEFRPEYNIRPVAGSSAGMSPSPETRAKLSAALKRSAHMRGKKHSLEMRAKLSAAAHARVRAPHSAETRAKIALAHRGFRHSLATRARISAAQRGKIVPSEARVKLSAALRLAYAEGRRGVPA